MEPSGNKRDRSFPRMNVTFMLQAGTPTRGKMRISNFNTNTTLGSDFDAEAQGRGERRDKAYAKSFQTLCVSAALL
jgi:hypothetical protein